MFRNALSRSLPVHAGEGFTEHLLSLSQLIYRVAFFGSKCAARMTYDFAMLCPEAYYSW